MKGKFAIWAGACSAVLAAGLLCWPSALDPVAGCVVLGAALGFTLAVHLVVDRSSARRRTVGPLVLFALAFTLILGSRAVSLTAGMEGRYFVYDGATNTTKSLYEHNLASDLPERSATPTPAFAALEPSNRKPSSAYTVRRSASDAYVGRLSTRLTFTSSEPLAYVAVEVPPPSGSTSVVAGGDSVAAGLAVQSADLKGSSGLEMHVRFHEGATTRDVTVARLDARELGTGWRRLRGQAHVPDRASGASLVLVVRAPKPDRSIAVSWDAPSVLPGPDVARDLVPQLLASDPSEPSPYRDSVAWGLSVTTAFLCLVVVGFLLPVGSRLERRVPVLQVASPRTRGGRRLLLGVAALGVLGYASEMASYGGYGEYFRNLQTVWTNLQGRWYLHALATLPAGLAVLLAVRRIASPERPRWTRSEVAVIVLGTVLCLSYWTKATIAIPLLTFLLALHFTRPNSGRWITAAAALFAVLTPWIYWVRGGGGAELGALFTTAYWNSFLDGLTSRFFQFESLMLSGPHPYWEPPWTPLVDLSTGVVPRAIWADKPLSESARYTQEFLLPGLHTGTDVGVLSLPGEFWLLGGPAGLVVGALFVGMLLRFIHALLSRPNLGPGRLLVGSAVLVAVLLLNDGEGLASVTTLVLIASAGWIVFVRPSRRRTVPPEPPTGTPTRQKVPIPS